MFTKKLVEVMEKIMVLMNITTSSAVTTSCLCHRGLESLPTKPLPLWTFMDL